jgi:hypothetical protein
MLVTTGIKDPLYLTAARAVSPSPVCIQVNWDTTVLLERLQTSLISILAKQSQDLLVVILHSYVLIMKGQEVL